MLLTRKNILLYTLAMSLLLIAFIYFYRLHFRLVFNSIIPEDIEYSDLHGSTQNVNDDLKRKYNKIIGEIIRGKDEYINKMDITLFGAPDERIAWRTGNK